MQHYIHGRARIITGLGIVVLNCGVSGDMYINSMPATEQPGNLLSRQLDSIACDRWARLLTKGKGSVADWRTRQILLHHTTSLAECFSKQQKGTASEELMAESSVIVIDTIGSGPFWDKIREWARCSDSALRGLVTFKVCGRGWLASELGIPQGLGMRPQRAHAFPSTPEALEMQLLLVCANAGLRKAESAAH